MTEHEERLRAVTDNPEDDAARLAFASYIRSHDPDRADVIEAQILDASARRAQREHAHPVPRKVELLRKHPEWTRTIAKYATDWTFDRGFIGAITIDPYLFLEYGEWLYVCEPIRRVHFTMPEEGEFPMKEIADSTLLAHLDSVRFAGTELIKEAGLREFAASQHLERLLDVYSNRRVAIATYEAFAAAPMTRKALTVQFSRDGFPGERFADTGDVDFSGGPVYDWTSISSDGRALEKKYGYLAWLHPKDNGCEPFDAAYYVAQGILPVKQPGSPVGE